MNESLISMYDGLLGKWHEMLQYRHDTFVRYAVIIGALVLAVAWIWKTVALREGTMPAHEESARRKACHSALRGLFVAMLAISTVFFLLELRTTRLIVAIGWAGDRLEKELLSQHFASAPGGQPQRFESVPGAVGNWNLSREGIFLAMDGARVGPGFFSAEHAVTDRRGHGTHSEYLLSAYAMVGILAMLCAFAPDLITGVQRTPGGKALLALAGVVVIACPIAALTRSAGVTPLSLAVRNESAGHVLSTLDEVAIVALFADLLLFIPLYTLLFRRAASALLPEKPLLGRLIFTVALLDATETLWQLMMVLRGQFGPQCVLFTLSMAKFSGFGLVAGCLTLLTARARRREAAS